MWRTSAGLCLTRPKDSVSIIPSNPISEVEESKSIDVSPAYVRDNYQFIKKSHKTLLIFRRMQKKAGNPLELRH